MSKVKMIVEGDSGVVFRDEILDTEWLNDLVESNYLEEVVIEAGVDKFKELVDDSWMSDSVKNELNSGIEKVKSQQGKYYVGGDGEYEVMLLVVY